MDIAIDRINFDKPFPTNLVREFKGTSPDNRVLSPITTAEADTKTPLALTTTGFTNFLNQPSLVAQFDQYGCARGWAPSTQYISGYENRSVFSSKGRYLGTQQFLVTIPQNVCVPKGEEKTTIPNYNQQQHPTYDEPTYSQPQDTTIYPQHGNRLPGGGYGNHHGRRDRNQQPNRLTICAKFPVGDARIRACANF